jgi:phosphoesterase RecJ-like protein
MYESVPYEDMKFLISVHATLKSAAGGRVVWFEIPPDQGRPDRTGWDLTEKILSFGRSIRGVEAVLLFRQTCLNPPQVRVNLRSSGALDVNAVAACFGGGGHPTASGATVSGTLGPVERRVIGEIRRRIRSVTSTVR